MIYRFLASLKLAVISIATLAATLAYATVFESRYGGGAAQDWIYRSPGFAILLAFLGMNILCAALIRYPWKRRQTGFVVTHAGLLILLAGSFYSVRTADEGQVGMLEGDVKGELVRIDYPVIRIWEVDPHTRERTRELDLPFRPGPFEWGPDTPRSAGVLQSALARVSFGFLGSEGSHEDVLTTPGQIRSALSSRNSCRRQPRRLPTRLTRTVRRWYGSGLSSRGRRCPRLRTHSAARTSTGSRPRKGSTASFAASPLP